MSERDRQLARVAAARARMGVTTARPVAPVVPRTRVDGDPGTPVPAPAPARPVPAPVAIVSGPVASPPRRVVWTKTAFRDALQNVADRHKVHPQDILGDLRYKHLVKARRELWATLRLKLGWSYPKISNYTNRDHSTVLHGVNEWIKENDVKDL